MLIDATYFIGEIDIPNTDKTSVQENLNIFIKKYEKIYLKYIMGDVLYDEYVAGIALDPIDPLWTDLQGQIRNTDDKTSPIANFVYWWYIRSSYSYNSGSGVVKSKNENAVNIDMASKSVGAWNSMVDETYRIAKYLNDNSLVYGDYYLIGIFNTWYLPRNTPPVFIKLNTFGI